MSATVAATVSPARRCVVVYDAVHGCMLGSTVVCWGADYIFEDMSILLSAIFFFCGLILLLETEISEQPRSIFANISGLGEYFSKPIFALKHWIQAGLFKYLEPYNRNNYHYYKVSVNIFPNILVELIWIIY